MNIKEFLGVLFVVAIAIGLIYVVYSIKDKDISIMPETPQETDLKPILSDINDKLDANHEQIESVMAEVIWLSEVLEKYEMYDEEVILDGIVQGVYYTDQMYCVWTQGLTEEEIYETEAHEICHDLVYRDYEHYCED